MNEIVFTIISSDRLLDTFLFKYEHLINQWYEKSQQPAYIERIQGGLVYIIKDFSTFKKMAEISPKTITTVHESASSKNYSLEFIKKDFFGDFVFPVNHQFEFIISNTVFPAEKIIPLWKTSLECIDKQIEFEIVDNYSFRLRFNTVDALVRYIAVVFNLNLNNLQ